MFTIVLLIGIYSYSIFILGIFGLLYKHNIILLTTIYLSIILYFYRENLKVNLLKSFKTFNEVHMLLLSLLILQMTINLVGTFAPELSFDALWYHLTLPKLYLEDHSVFFIPGGLLYYSAMPKLAEMLYAGGLAFGNEIIPKLTHFSFGILTLFAIYKISRKFVSKEFSLLTAVLFYSNLVVGWMSITAYADLTRTFFEVMALWMFLEWYKRRRLKLLIVSALMLGFAISTKLLALSSLLIFTILILFILLKKTKIKLIITNILVYWWFAVLVPLPWFIFSYVNTGNSIYPFFTCVYPIKPNFALINPLNLADPISPMYIILLPLAIFFYKKFNQNVKLIALYSFLSVAVWFITPQTGGGRFILPYLPAISILSIIVIKHIKNAKIKFILVSLLIFFAIFSIIYRGVANFKYVPVILGQESKAEFLSKNLNFSFGDFYDTDGYFSKTIKKEDKVLLYGFHNLYYVDFPFIDSSWLKTEDKFNYIATQNTDLPKQFKKWKQIYSNPITFVKLYKE